jgi:sialate O-acetylesterase
VAVGFAGQTATATADKDGKWMATLTPMAPSLEGREMTVESAADGGKLSLSDVVVGDVWLCSGQSNMHFRMKQVHHAAAEIAAANNPAIRFFYTEPAFAQQPLANVTGAWKRASPETVDQCSAVAYFFARDLQPVIGVPVGLLLSSVGGTRIETWMQRETLSRLGLTTSLVEKWERLSPQRFAAVVDGYSAYQHQLYKVHPELVRNAKRDGTPIPPEPPRPQDRPHDCPSALHHAMIAPLEPFAIRGALWYQGEGNVGNPAAYEKLLPAMIADWRATWGAELPFLFVQLAPHNTITPQMREAQLRIWKSTPRTGMVAAIDVGHPTDIHPTRKQPVGERLARAGRALAYGEPVEFSGPVFESMRIDGSRAVISFAHAGAGLMAKGDALEGFAIAGGDGKFFPAKAEIDGSKVVVWAEEVAKPTIVHFGYANVPKVNLFNRDGLPALPFRSDMPSLPKK